jgi:hypothetical protein
VFVDQGFQYDQFHRLIEYRPQRIFGVVVEPQKRTRLNITVHEGKELEEIGQLDVATEKASNPTAELARLRHENEELTKQLQACQPRR